ncbi:MAG: hypothetical protein ACTHJ0_08205, partial [Flavipsychrobacter sp.]
FRPTEDATFIKNIHNMKTLSFIALALLGMLTANAETNIKAIKKVANGLYVMYYDTSSEKRIVTKSTIVEFKNYIVLMEMPISNDGAGATNLKDHSEGGEAVLAALKAKFPNKPLKYVLSSHWHPHSISSILPFVSKGITVVTTRNNFKRLSEFVDSANFNKYRKYIHFVDEDSLIIKDKDNKIVAYKFNKRDYPAVPTEDFLYFYLPKYNYLHCSCMFQRFAGYKAKGKEIISVRAEDLEKFIKGKNIDPDYLITTDTYWDDATGMVPGDTMRMMFKKGIGMYVMENELLQIDEQTLSLKSDSIINYLLSNDIPGGILNGAVYTALKKNELKQALALARLQALINPANPNSWDTYGEVCYFLGETRLAKRYEAQSKKIDKEFTQGGEATWKQDLEDFRKLWAEK